MTNQTYDFILGMLLVFLGGLILVYKVMNPLSKDENVSGKAAHFQVIVLAIGLILTGLIMM